MDIIPKEILENILERLPEYESQVTARFPLLSPISKGAILASRLVCRPFKDSKALQDLFVGLLEESPFFRVGYHMPEVEAISRSEYAERMTTLSLCSMTKPDSKTSKWTQFWDHKFVDELASVLAQFPKIKHLRYYPILQECIKNPMSHSITTDLQHLEGLGYSGVANGEFHTNLPRFLCAFEQAEIAFETLVMPLFGNQSPLCAIEPAIPAFPTSLTRLAINANTWWAHPWNLKLPNLEFLEVALSQPTKARSDSVEDFNIGWIVSRGLMGSELRRIPQGFLPRLVEFRVMADPTFCFSENQIMDALSAFPSLRRLGFAHMQLKVGRWPSLLTKLQTLSLDILWMLNLGHHFCSPGHPVLRDYERYTGDEQMKAAAREVRLINTYKAGLRNTRIGKGPEYAGFSTFEQE